MDMDKAEMLALRLGEDIRCAKTLILDDFAKVCPTADSYALIRKSVLDVFGDIDRGLDALMRLIIQ